MRKQSEKEEMEEKKKAEGEGSEETSGKKGEGLKLQPGDKRKQSLTFSPSHSDISESSSAASTPNAMIRNMTLPSLPSNATQKTKLEAAATISSQRAGDIDQLTTAINKLSNAVGQLREVIEDTTRGLYTLQ